MQPELVALVLLSAIALTLNTKRVNEQNSEMCMYLCHIFIERNLKWVVIPDTLVCLSQIFNENKNYG